MWQLLHIGPELKNDSSKLFFTCLSGCPPSQGRLEHRHSADVVKDREELLGKEESKTTFTVSREFGYLRPLTLRNKEP